MKLKNIKFEQFSLYFTFGTSNPHTGYILSRTYNLIFIHLNPAWKSIIFRNCQICNSFGFKNDIMITDDFNLFKMSLAFCAPQTGCPLFRWRHLLSIGLWNSSRAGSDEIQKIAFSFKCLRSIVRHMAN